MTIDLPKVGRDKFKGVDIRIRVRGGGNMSQAYAVRQAIAKGIVAYYREFLPPTWISLAAGRRLPMDICRPNLEGMGQGKNLVLGGSTFH